MVPDPPVVVREQVVVRVKDKQEVEKVARRQDLAEIVPVLIVEQLLPIK